MTLQQLTSGATRALNRAGLHIKKHSPEILVVAGVVGTVVSAVLACKATTKVSAILEETKQQVDSIHEVANNPELADKYSPEDAQKDLTIVYGQTGLKFVKLYGPAVLLGAVSITSILAGHNISRKRNIALTAGLATAMDGFKQYRSRVTERFGDQMDKELLYNIKAKALEEIVVDENGNETTVTKTVEVADAPVAQGLYTFCFDETASGWQRDAEANKFFLLQQQDYANEKLRAKGHMFLNEVLDMLGIPRQRVGQAVGWFYDKNNPIGDNYIDFGIFNIQCEANRNFVNGLEKSIWLNFNVDGDILGNL